MGTFFVSGQMVVDIPFLHQGSHLFLSDTVGA